MTHFGINGSYFMHSTPEYNASHKKQNSEYNKKYYQAHKEKWGVDKDSDSSSDLNDKDEKSKDSKKSSKKILPKLNGGSKAISKSSKSKKASSNKESSSKKKETEEEKAEREKKEQEEAERKAAEERQKNAEYAEKLKQQQEALAKIAENQNGVKKKKPNVRKSNNAVKHSCIYISVNKESYLKHHGITNQRWGVKHGPPYPLAREVAKAVKKGAFEGLKQGGKQAKQYAIQNTIRPATDRIQKKKNPQPFNAKKIATGALVIAGSALATGIISRLVDFGVDKAIKGGKAVVANMLVNAPNEGLANVGVNMLLDAARTTRR